jgi:hypothetical protein
MESEVFAADKPSEHSAFTLPDFVPDRSEAINQTGTCEWIRARALRLREADPPGPKGVSVLLDTRGCRRWEGPLPYKFSTAAI